MPLKCCVPGCRSNYGGDYVAVFRFPKDEIQRQDWLRLIRRTDHIVTRNSSVCIRHFSDEVVRSSERFDRRCTEGRPGAKTIRHTLIPGAMPTIINSPGDAIRRRRPRSSYPSLDEMVVSKVGVSSIPVQQEPEVPSQRMVEARKRADRPSSAVVKAENGLNGSTDFRRQCNGRESPDRKWNRMQAGSVPDGPQWPIGSIEVEQAPCFMVSSLQDVTEHLKCVLPQLQNWTYLLKTNKLVLAKVTHEGGPWPPRITRSIVLWPDLSFSLYDERSKLTAAMLVALDINFETVIQNHDVDFLIECLD